MFFLIHVHLIFFYLHLMFIYILLIFLILYLIPLKVIFFNMHPYFLILNLLIMLIFLVKVIIHYQHAFFIIKLNFKNIIYKTIKIYEKYLHFYNFLLLLILFQHFFYLILIFLINHFLIFLFLPYDVNQQVLNQHLILLPIILFIIFFIENLILFFFYFLQQLIIPIRVFIISFPFLLLMNLIFIYHIQKKCFFKRQLYLRETFFILLKILNVFFSSLMHLHIFILILFIYFATVLKFYDLILFYKNYIV